jgi:hypothetical protein
VDDGGNRMTVRDDGWRMADGGGGSEDLNLRCLSRDRE